MWRKIKLTFIYSFFVLFFSYFILFFDFLFSYKTQQTSGGRLIIKLGHSLIRFIDIFLGSSLILFSVLVVLIVYSLVHLFFLIKKQKNTFFNILN